MCLGMLPSRGGTGFGGFAGRMVELVGRGLRVFLRILFGSEG